MSGVLVAVATLPLLAAVIIRLASTSSRTTARLAVGASGAAAIGALVLLIKVGLDGPVDAVITNSDGVAVIGLTADRVGAILLLLTSTVGLIVQSFASRSLLGDPRATRFHVLACALAGATSLVGVAATGSGFVVAWIATTVTLVALLGHKAPWPAAVRSQRLTSRTFLVGDASLLLAVVLAIGSVGDLDLRNIGGDAASLDAESIGPLSMLTIVATLLVVSGVARSALVPMHAWLPSTLAAPTPVSALLHAGVINGAGVVLIRFSPVFASSVSAMVVAFGLGIATALFATAVMLVRTDVKGGLVWSTAGQMGFMMMQLGVGAFAAALFHIVGHALFKAAMFLGAGGAITARNRQMQRPHLGRSSAAVLNSNALRLVIGVLTPLAAFALALRFIEPHLTPAATILIVLFGALSVGRAASGWMSATPFAAGHTIALAIAGVLVMTFGYVGGIAVFEAFVVGVVPYEVPSAVGPLWVVAALSAIAAGVLVVVFTPGPRGEALRRNAYGWLLSTSTPITVHRSDRAVALSHATVIRSTDTALAPAELATAGDHT